MVYPYSFVRLLLTVGLLGFVVSAQSSGNHHHHHQQHRHRHHGGNHHHHHNHHLDKILPRSSSPSSSEGDCGCDEDASLQHHLSSGKLLSPRSLNQQLKPNNLMMENLGNYGFVPLNLSPPHPHPPQSSPADHLLLRPSVSQQLSAPTIVTTAEARPARQFNYPNMSPRQAKVNEYFYKSDPGHPIMSPYTLKGKDGRLYTNYRPDHQVPDEHLPSAAATGSSSRYVPAPSSSVLGRRVARSLMPSEMFMGSPQPGMEMDPIKRNDGSELMYPSDFGFASPGSYPRPGASASGVPPQLWNSFAQLSPPQWSSSNLSPVPVRLSGLTANGLTNPGNPLIQGSSPVNSPGANGVPMPGSTPGGSPGSPGQQMNMHNWFNFLNQPFYGPPMMNPFQTMTGNPIDPSQQLPQPLQPQLPQQLQQQQQQQSTGNSSTEKGEKNTSGEDNSNDDSANKPNNRRQRLLNQLNNLSRAPLENIRNFFQRVTSTTTTESPKDNES
ncbi:uncharacterized protein LOC128392838 [Panonychus citri]|uniref:uncharacterized protein LOC128392838 n=1 Tax=Panonychus citri TaxID=50023 RepID=UPI002307DA0E|nr:uncharacterized protein LOC128392838 [Panonychus citri]